MSRFRVLPVPATVVDEARSSRRSPQYGHPAHVEVATGTGPCRSCLAPFALGAEERLLFTYDAFSGVDAYPEPGPIFVHVERCTPHDGDGFPAGLRGLPLTFEAFGAERWMLRREHLGERAPEPLLEELLDLAGVSYVNIRNHEAGCFIARVERRPSAASDGASSPR
jgi:hypothetical protein